MKHYFPPSLGVVLASTTLVTLVAGCTSATTPTSDQMSSSSAMTSMITVETELRQVMRKLWAEHVIWTRQYIVAAVAGTPDAEAAATRLLKNQNDIGTALIPYYGADAGAAMTELLKEHILIAVDLVAAAKAGDDAKFTEEDARWQANAEDIADFLSSANPAWPRQAMLDMMNEHLSVTKQEAVARIEGEWDDDVAAFDSIFNYALIMADEFTDGIVKQFPEKF